jgi:putative two-component system response regulator
MMPGLSGYDTCVRLKQDPAIAAIPVIFVTALSDTMDETRGFDVGAVDYITKPANPAVVRARAPTCRWCGWTSCADPSGNRAAPGPGGRIQGQRDRPARDPHEPLLAPACARAGQSPHEAEDLLHAAPMHDVGKIGIPDAILRKPASSMPTNGNHAQHPSIGADIIGEHAGGLCAWPSVPATTKNGTAAAIRTAGRRRHSAGSAHRRAGRRVRR